MPRKFMSLRDRAKAWIRSEIKREARDNMLSYTAARQQLDIYEMRLETLDTRLVRRVIELEDRVAALEAARDRRAEPIAKPAPEHRQLRTG